MRRAHASARDAPPRFALEIFQRSFESSGIVERDTYASRSDHSSLDIAEQSGAGLPTEAGL